MGPRADLNGCGKFNRPCNLNKLGFSNKRTSRLLLYPPLYKTHLCLIAHRKHFFESEFIIRTEPGIFIEVCFSSSFLSFNHSFFLSLTSYY